MTIPAEELINKKLSSFIGRIEFNRDIYDNLLLLSQDGIPRKMEYSLNSKDGILWKSANLYLLTQEPEKVYCLQINDITTFKNAEENLKKNLMHEKELAELKSRFVTLTSHEFRTPLTSISTSNELVSMLLKKSEIPINDQLEKYINNIQNQVKHMANLVDDVIKIGKIDANKIVLNLVDLNLKEAIVEIIENLLFTHKIPRKIKINVKGEPFSIMMDFNALEHILENIINNAFKYSPNKPDPILEIDFINNQIILALQDFGIGIPKEDQPLLFEHFYRASNVGKIEGVGLGLVIVKNLVNQLQGNLKIDSEEDKGTRIEITFYKNNLK
jgi:signal transduction histidine kinase